MQLALLTTNYPVYAILGIILATTERPDRQNAWVATPLAECMGGYPHWQKLGGNTYVVSPPHRQDTLIRNALTGSTSVVSCRLQMIAVFTYGMSDAHCCQ